MSGRSIAVLGAGLAGLTCARALTAAGDRVVVFDKGRSVAGRMAVRRIAGASDDSPSQFDHGAQYFTARSPEFVEQVERWQAQKVVARWDGPFVRLTRGMIDSDPGLGDARYVGTPGMNALCKQLAEGLTVHCGIRITRLDADADGWKLTGEPARTSAGNARDFKSLDQNFAAVVSTLPAPQAVDLLPEETSFRPELSQIRLGPCWSVLLELSAPLGVEFNAAFVQESPLRWMARENAKPGRAEGTERWVLHASPEWSTAHLEQSEKEVAALLVHAFAEATGQVLPQVLQSEIHRWKYAIPENPLSCGCLIDRERHLIAAGDWCAEARVEGAYRSGLAAAKAIEQLFS